MSIAFDRLSKLDRKVKILVILVNDFLCALICWLVFGPPMATYIVSEFSTGIFQIIASEWKAFLFPIILTILYFYILDFYASLIKFFDSKDSILVCLSGSLIYGSSSSLIHIYQFQIVSTSFLFIAMLQGILLSAVFYAFLNITRDLAKYFLYPHHTNSDARKIVIYGAGNSGMELYRSILEDPSKKVISFFDDGKNLRDQKINNIPVLGTFKQLINLKKSHPDMEVLLAIPRIKSERRREIISKLEQIKVAVKSVPSYKEIISDQKQLTDLQDLSLDDLLPRATVSRDILKDAAEKTLLISGAGGSIGSEIVRQLLDSNPKAIILFDLSEINLFYIERECQAIKLAKQLKTKIIPILGDIRDYQSIDFLFAKFSINCVYHAAAYKHVPLVEDVNNIIKGCENNIIGTHNLATASIKYKVKSFVMVSTDKAVRPSNVMGASKRMAEMIIQSLNADGSDTNFSMVRFGNVINSSGSVIPLFLDQISKGGPITVTDKNVTRYFMTIPEASNLVLQAAQMADGGEVFILNMGEQFKIFDLAKKLIHLSGRNIALESNSKGIQIVEVGLRPGEKMYEELLISGEQLPTDNPKIFKSMEKFPSLEIMQPLIEDIKSSIKNNDHRMIKSILKKMLRVI